MKSPPLLVLGPRFPAINQAWLDTYLIHLLKNGIDFAVCTHVETPGPYHQRVDDYGLRDRAVYFQPKLQALIGQVAAFALRHPLRFARSWRKASRFVEQFTAVGIGYLPTMLKLVFYDEVFTEFADTALIHSHSEVTGYEFLHFALMRDIPLLFTYHGLLPPGVPQLTDAKRRLLLRNVKASLVNSDFTRKQLVSLGGDDATITEIPQGIDSGFFHWQPKPKPELGQCLELLSVGRVQEDKGYRHALAAVARLKRAGKKVRHTIVGSGPNEPMLHRQIARLGLQNDVRHITHANADELRALYHACDIFMLTSISNDKGTLIETQGVVLQEAQACGANVLATRVGGMVDVIAHQITGQLVAERSSRAIADGITELLALSADEWRAMQERSRAVVEQRFDANVIGERVAEFLRQHAPANIDLETAKR